MELDFELENEFKIEKLDKINFNKNLSIFNTKFLLSNLKLDNKKQEILKEDLIKYVNCPPNLLLGGRTTKVFSKSEIENQFKSQFKSNTSISKEECINETIKLYQLERNFDIFKVDSNLRLKKDLSLEVNLKISYNSTLERYIKQHIIDLMEIKSNNIIKNNKNNYSLQILENTKIKFSFLDKIENKNIFINKLNNLQSQYEQILYLNMLQMNNKIKLI